MEGKYQAPPDTASLTAHRVSMKRNENEAPIEDVRALAQERAEQTSIRAAAEEIGLGHSTVHNFLRGAEPHPRVRRKLLAWYAWGAAPDGGVKAAGEALDALTEGLPGEHRVRARAVLLDVVEQAHRAVRDHDVPGWIGALRESR
jgi:hypothetical protein